jgi:hypothetical protein
MSLTQRGDTNTKAAAGEGKCVRRQFRCECFARMSGSQRAFKKFLSAIDSARRDGPIIFGSPGRIRTSDQPVNSRLLYR